MTRGYTDEEWEAILDAEQTYGCAAANPNAPEYKEFKEKNKHRMKRHKLDKYEAEAELEEKSPPTTPPAHQ